MKSPKQIKREARQLYRFCLVKGRVNESRARLVIAKVLDAKRHGYLAVLGEFHRLLKIEDYRNRAEVESAVPLPPDLQHQVQRRIEGLYGTGITTQFQHEPSLIGGMRVKIGSDVYDGSVRYELVALARSFGITNGKNPG